MKRVDFWLDFVSPDACLAFEQLPHALEGLGYEVCFRPVLLAEQPLDALGLLRLAHACARQGAPNRYVCETILHCVRRDGAAAHEAERLKALSDTLAPARDPASDEVKQALRAETDAAIAAGVSGVPTFGVDGRLFRGLDALPMLRAQLQGDTELEPIWAAPASVAQGVAR